MSTRAERLAGLMGARAGERYRDAGVPTPNPFDKVADLARAWRAGYYRALRPASRRRPRR